MSATETYVNFPIIPALKKVPILCAISSKKRIGMRKKIFFFAHEEEQKNKVIK